MSESKFTCSCLTLVQRDEHPIGHVYGPIQSVAPSHPNAIVISLVKIEIGATERCDRTAVVDCPRCRGTGRADATESEAAKDVAVALETFDELVTAWGKWVTADRDQIVTWLHALIDDVNTAPTPHEVANAVAEQLLKTVPANLVRATELFVLSERRKKFARQNGVDTTAKTIPPQAPSIAVEGLEANAQALAQCADIARRLADDCGTAAFDKLAGILAMRADASRPAIADRARLEIERLRTFESSPPTDRQFDALLTTLDTCARWHEITIPLVRQTKALVVALREQLAAVERKTTESNRYRLEMETLTGAGHPAADEGLRFDLQLADGEDL